MSLLSLPRQPQFSHSCCTSKPKPVLGLKPKSNLRKSNMAIKSASSLPAFWCTLLSQFWFDLSCTLFLYSVVVSINWLSSPPLKLPVLHWESWHGVLAKYCFNYKWCWRRCGDIHHYWFFFTEKVCISLEFCSHMAKNFRNSYNSSQLPLIELPINADGRVKIYRSQQCFQLSMCTLTVAVLFHLFIRMEPFGAIAHWTSCSLFSPCFT